MFLIIFTFWFKMIYEFVFFSNQELWKFYF